MKKEKGVSVIELIIVMIAIGVLSAILIPQFKTYSGFKLRGATQALVSHMRYAQQQAITTQVSHQVVLDLVQNEYSVEIARADYLTMDAEGQVNYVDDGSKVWLKNAQSGKKLDVDLDGVVLTGTTATQVEFNSLGVATVSGTGSQVVLNYRGDSKTITITEATGKINVQ